MRRAKSLLVIGGFVVVADAVKTCALLLGVSLGGGHGFAEAIQDRRELQTVPGFYTHGIDEAARVGTFEVLSHVLSSSTPSAGLRPHDISRSLRSLGQAIGHGVVERYRTHEIPQCFPRQ